MANFVREKHGHAIWSVAWSTDEFHVDKDDDQQEDTDDTDNGSNNSNENSSTSIASPKRQETVRYMATCGGKYVSLYQISCSDKSDDAMTLRQAYVDRDDEEVFFCCAFGGRSLGRPFGFSPVQQQQQQQQQQQKGWVVLCHGLESNSHSNLSRDMALSYYNKGLNVACLNFRGCSDEPNLQLGGYHLGFTDDLLLFLEHLNSRNTQQQPVYLSGFSLGANVILKALGDEMKLQAVTKYNIQGATAFCVPYCAERNAPFLGRPGFNQVVYCGNLLSTLKQRAHRQLNQHCNGNIHETEKFDYPGVVQAKTITDFDQAFVARVYGFESAIDYYRKTSCIRYLPDIAVPTFILTAEDDPFMDPTLFPIETTIEGGGPAPIKMVKMKNGGHCGFVFHQVEDKENVLETSWSSTEMARFLEHIMTATST